MSKLRLLFQSLFHDSFTTISNSHNILLISILVVDRRSRLITWFPLEAVCPIGQRQSGLGGYVQASPGHAVLGSSTSYSAVLLQSSDNPKPSRPVKMAKRCNSKVLLRMYARTALVTTLV